MTLHSTLRDRGVLTRAHTRNSVEQHTKHLNVCLSQNLCMHRQNIQLCLYADVNNVLQVKHTDLLIIPGHRVKLWVPNASVLACCHIDFFLELHFLLASLVELEIWWGVRG